MTPERFQRLRRMNAAQVLKKQTTEPVGFYIVDRPLQRHLYLDVIASHSYPAREFPTTREAADDGTSMSDRGRGMSYSPVGRGARGGRRIPAGIAGLPYRLPCVLCQE